MVDQVKKGEFSVTFERFTKSAKNTNQNGITMARLYYNGFLHFSIEAIHKIDIKNKDRYRLFLDRSGFIGIKKDDGEFNFSVRNYSPFIKLFIKTFLKRHNIKLPKKSRGLNLVFNKKYDMWILYDSTKPEPNPDHKYSFQEIHATDREKFKLDPTIPHVVFYHRTRQFKFNEAAMKLMNHPKGLDYFYSKEKNQIAVHPASPGFTLTAFGRKCVCYAGSFLKTIPISLERSQIFGLVKQDGLFVLIPERFTGTKPKQKKQIYEPEKTSNKIKSYIVGVKGDNNTFLAFASTKQEAKVLAWQNGLKALKPGCYMDVRARILNDSMYLNFADQYKLDHKIPHVIEFKI